MPPSTESKNTSVEISVEPWQCNEQLLTIEQAQRCLEKLDEVSATGADKIPVKILKKCAKQLALPVYLIGVAILKSGFWPAAWIQHWIAAIYKKKSVCDPKNYRGVHMTAQLAKVLERFLGGLFLPQLSREIVIGPNQFAYVQKRGSRDALAYMVLAWLSAFMEKARIALYCSDVSGAFDKVSASRLLEKLKAKGMPSALIKVVSSWLRDRVGHVVVAGAQSAMMLLKDMVFQGTVWGPTLWNVFYEDARWALREHNFREFVFADDLNGYRIYSKREDDATILGDIKSCQKELHSWGLANQVEFDPGKESSHILSRNKPLGPNFKILGVEFDCKLIMSDTVHSLAVNARWKLTSILRTGKFLTGLQMVDIYKAQLLSFLEYRTPAIYHACDTSLFALDNVQRHLLEAAGLTAIDALFVCNLAPLSTRRDMALLGLIHRTVLGLGPTHSKDFFIRTEAVGKHRFQLREYRDGHSSDYRFPNSRPAEYIWKSALGLTQIYNRLPRAIVEGSSSVATFQSALQHLIRDRALSHANWEQTFSPRVELSQHPLNSCA